MTIDTNPHAEQPPEKKHQSSWLSSNWPVALGWLCVGLYSILAAQRFPLGAAQVGVAVAYASDEILAKRAPPSKRLTLVRLFAGAIFLTMLMTKLLPSARWE